jgi:hypothetical protein
LLGAALERKRKRATNMVSQAAGNRC